MAEALLTLLFILSTKVQCVPTYSDECHIVSTELAFNVDSDVREDVYKYATLAELEAFIASFNSPDANHYRKVSVDFFGPKPVSAEAVIVLSPTSQVLDEDEIPVLESALLQGVNKVGHVDVDATITGYTIFVQQIVAADPDTSRRHRVLQEGESNLVRVRARGLCEMGCEQEDFIREFHTVLAESMEGILLGLQTSPATDYFQEVTSMGLVADPLEEANREYPELEELGDPLEEADFQWWVIVVIFCSLLLIAGAVAYGIYYNSKNSTMTTDPEKQVSKEGDVDTPLKAHGDQDDDVNE